MPGSLDEMPAAIKARDAELLKFIDNIHALMCARFDEGEGRFSKIEMGLAENTRETKQISKTVESLLDELKDMIEVSKAAKGAIKVLNWVGALAKPLGSIVILVGAIVGAWAAIKGLISPSDLRPPK